MEIDNTLIEVGEALSHHHWAEVMERIRKNNLDLDKIWKGYHLMRDLSNLKWKQSHEIN